MAVAYKMTLAAAAGLILSAGTGIVSAGANETAPWSRDIAILFPERGAFGSDKAAERKEADVRKETQALGGLVQGMGLNPAFENAEIFLPENRARRGQYRRILIPRSVLRFSLDMYAGMTRYVRAGGLLISNSSLYDTRHGTGRGFETLGVYVANSARAKAITALLACPLTVGLQTDTALPLNPGIGDHHDAVNNSATPVVVFDGENQYGRVTGRIFLSYKHLEKGACVYFLPNMLLSQPVVRLLVTDIFSAATLEWLTLQERPAP